MQLEYAKTLTREVEAAAAAPAVKLGDDDAAGAGDDDDMVIVDWARPPALWACSNWRNGLLINNTQ